ncbi:MAG: hemerythrin domain-containing protein [Actinomycetes bacterium]
MSQDSVTAAKDLSTVRARRAYLRRACQELETALAAPLTGRPDEWLRQVLAAVVFIRQAFEAHIAITEDADGLFNQVLADAPRLEPLVRRLRREHEDISAALATAEQELRTAEQAELERAREELTATLAEISRHRQRGADLLYEAYEVDIGGE